MPRYDREHPRGGHPKDHRWSHPKTIRKLSRKPYGIQLATTLIERLISGHQLSNSHRDYCGQGIKYVSGSFIIANVNDGYFEEPLMKFTTRDEFLTFLSRQSDFSLCNHPDSGIPELSMTIDCTFGINNQTITKSRIDQFLRDTAPAKVAARRAAEEEHRRQEEAFRQTDEYRAQVEEIRRKNEERQAEIQRTIDKRNGLIPDSESDSGW
eukprot:gnl/Dysnectes_brevis/2977_a3668_1272.p1 GENE.gnl/Dysnectes_brevis/2977_a3668_1272~~gnl/Dysnectes_brevis/2977_a3668_1272.p1  ORF type:complete len:210 (+),score=3.59 gnl/Dysnectes_brevis/2977_a3668_1272:48-677(+)